MRTPRWVVVTYVILILAGVLAALPNMFTPQQLAALPSWVPKQQITLGLDLQGGSHLVLEVDAAALKTDRLRSLLDDMRNTLRKERIDSRSARISSGVITVTIDNPDQLAKAQEVIGAMATQIGITGQKDLDVTTEGKLIKVALTDAGINDRLNAALQQSLEIVRQRVDQVGVAEPTIQRVGSNRMLVQLPGLQDPTRLRQLLGSTAKMTFHLLANTANGEPLPVGVTMLPDAKSGAQYPVEDRVALDGEHLTDARASFDQRTHEPLVTFRFDSIGARKFAEITSANVGRPFAIVLDGKVLSAPVIREPITGGSGQISGNFTVDETSTLSALLRAGALPAPLTVIEERTVGPDLGGDVIKMGIYTGIAGFAAVVLFMVALYGSWGMIANFALFLHLVLTFGVLNIIGATLTLPGIAGIILGIGFGVDANILINERIREEAKKGLSAFAALDNGFKRAYSTIVDANVTSLIATSLLFMFGSGPVKGFAITMFLGTCLSMFTAVSVTRILMASVVRRKKLKTITIEPLVRFFPDKTSIAFMKGRYLGIATSILLSLASVALFIKPGLNYGIDFKGGIQVEITTSQPADLATLRSTLSDIGVGEVTLQQVGGVDNDVLIRVQRQEGGEQAQTKAVDAVKQAVLKLDPAVKFDKTDVVGPKVSGELAQSGVMAVVLAALAMLAYIWWRFEWNFAIGAIATLILDTTKMVGFFALFQLDFNLTAIAALLTIIGYSVNDKVVVYDRMRENLRLYKKMPLREIIDMSINQVFARCIYTSVAILLSMAPMAIWGGSAVENFAVPMVFGVVVATTSSIFIAAPILLLLGDWWKHRHQREEAAASANLVKA
ncbi:protein translocase subunit SecD [Mesorhizobium sp. YM1C-6-2]|uniref:protein translocase subunit SecD n=1 Tax=Mesorhizobium sp. YM1C-6-2 TaxID=1827501 RepID=UPI000EF294FC|nr:protein translocase subunit SecD [Mesorhizobium sp. YM1C-6-2]RLP24928.1 protein translocase subunit SecD [Mesorhizobium sp. YM1C-6-2]